MALTPGIRLGPYEIIAPIGAGGMGEVYRATDSQLKRAVAIKVLPAAMASDADRLARFQREAEVLAALNHPNIAQIYGLEKTADLTALVMELVEGEDLSTLISGARGLQTPGSSPGSKDPGLHLADALPIARQIADALEAAHDQGIVHRDLKPQNIKVRADGTVKVLDFGLAKASDPPASSSSNVANSPTMTSPAMTAMGMILGTAAYMAPEQARGRAVDKRADIWAFGVVLFEMLTGTRAYAGDDVTDTIVSVVSKEPDWNALPASTPAALRRLVTRCLKKDPKARLRDIGDARLQIEELIAGAPDDAATVVSAPAVAPKPAPARSAVLPWTAAGVLAIALAIVLWLGAPWGAASTPGTSAMQLTPLSFEQGGQTGAVWSPDGKAVAFGARQKDTDPYQLYVRYLDSPVANRITSTPTVVNGVIQWTTTGKIIFYGAAGFYSVSPVGGEPERLSSKAGMDIASLKLEVAGVGAALRDGTAVAALFRDFDGVLGVWTARGDAGLTRYEPAPFASRSSFNTPNLNFSPDGTLLLLLRNAGEGEEAWLMPYPASASDPPRRILPGLKEFGVYGTPTASWLPDNRHVVLSATPTAAPRQLYLADTVSGVITPISSGTTAQTSPAVSPDGRRIAFLEGTSDRDIVSVDLSTAAVSPVIATQRSEQMPAWAARESAMVYVTDRNGQMEIWLQKPGQPDRPVVTPRDFPAGKTRGFYGPALSPDGTRVIYGWVENGALTSLWISALAGGPPVRLVKNPGGDSPGSWSPDGNWFVFRRLENGKQSLHKAKTTGDAESEVLDAAGTGSWVPVWSPGGDWILYNGPWKLISPDGKTRRDLSPTKQYLAPVCTFSADGRTVYCIRQTAANGPGELFSVSLAGGQEKVIGALPRGSLPSVSLNPSLRLSLAPDAKSLTFSTLKATSNLWLMDGLMPGIGK